MSLTMPAMDAVASVVSNTSAGVVMVMRGGVVSSVTVIVAVPALPPGEAAVAVIRFGPSASGSATLNRPLTTVAGIELIVTVADGSSTVPDTVVGVIFV